MFRTRKRIAELEVALEQAGLELSIIQGRCQALEGITIGLMHCLPKPGRDYLASMFKDGLGRADFAKFPGPSDEPYKSAYYDNLASALMQFVECIDQRNEMGE